PRVRTELAPSQIAEARQCGMELDEVFRRRDVVVHEDHRIWQGIRESRGVRSHREMMNEQAIAIAEVTKRAIVVRQLGEPCVCDLDEDLGIVSRVSQRSLDAEDFVANRVAFGELRQDLMHTGHVRLRTASPAGGTSRRWRAIHPGIGRMSARSGSLCRRTSMSRYLRSTMRQS